MRHEALEKKGNNNRIQYQCEKSNKKKDNTIPEVEAVGVPLRETKIHNNNHQICDF